MRDSIDTTRLADLVERMARLVHGGLHADGLPPAQWQALAYLARANRFSRTPSALGLYLDATKGTVSQTLIALERKGLVAKRRDPNDRRSVALTLTSRGFRLLEAHPLAEVVAALEAMGEAERRKLEQGLAGLLGHLIRARGGRSFGQCRSCRFFEPGAGGQHRCRMLDVALSDDDAAQICHEHSTAA